MAEDVWHWATIVLIFCIQTLHQVLPSLWPLRTSQVVHYLSSAPIRLSKHLRQWIMNGMCFAVSTEINTILVKGANNMKKIHYDVQIITWTCRILALFIWPTEWLIQYSVGRRIWRFACVRDRYLFFSKLRNLEAILAALLPKQSFLMLRQLKRCHEKISHIVHLNGKK